MQQNTTPGDPMEYDQYGRNEIDINSIKHTAPLLNK